MRFLQCCVYSLDVMIYFREKHDNEKLRKALSILLIPIGILRYILVSLKACFPYKRENKCAVVLIIKNEGKYIKEYINYYKRLGCDIIIYDNDSNDESKEIICRYSDVIYIPWHGKKRQIDAYNHACKKFKKYKYIFLFDADEFLVADELFSGKTIYQIINEIFSSQKRIACLGINWLIFGSNGLVDDPEDGVINSFTRCANDDFEWNQLVKSCVDPSKIVGWVDPHLPIQVFGYEKINLDGEKIVQPRISMPQKRNVRLYHYFVKNRKHFEEKVNKGMADRNAKRSMDEFYYYDKNDVLNMKAVELIEYMKLNSGIVK